MKKEEFDLVISALQERLDNCEKYLGEIQTTEDLKNITIIAHCSDELRTSFGRRKPFMVAGCGFYAIFLVLLFSPPMMKTGVRNISIWFGVFYVLFFMAETITNVPYLALGPELSSNSKQRERLYFFFYVFQYIGVLFAAAARSVFYCEKK